MKKLFGPAWLTAWLAGVLPDSIFRLGKKTPWYRRSWIANIPWIAVALVAPFVIFLIWKGVELLLPRGETSESDGQSATLT